ncbi:MAG: L-alanine exporter AlaE [Candidatus Liptonbacteria bacterium]|nr:L-alanine exporter AlaE [Candidatus Liptonbacteria bacterium]
MINRAHALVKRHLGKLIAADTIALALYGGVCSAFVYLIEVKGIAIPVGKWFAFRGLYNFFLFGGACFCGWITNKSRAILQGTSDHIVRRWLAEGISLSLYKIPIYVASAYVCNVAWSQIFQASAVDLGLNLVTGRLYGWILDWTRHRFAVNSVNHH